MKVYMPFIKANSSGPWVAGSLLATDTASLAEYNAMYTSEPAICEIVWHMIYIEPDAGMQSCEATQVTSSGEPQICADRREIEAARKG